MIGMSAHLLVNISWSSPWSHMVHVTVSSPETLFTNHRKPGQNVLMVANVQMI